MKRILSIAAAGAFLAGCAQVSDVTKISGTVNAEAIDEVNVVIPEMSIDTLVPVVDGKFYVEVPANPMTIGGIAAANYRVRFIPDGTALDVVLGEVSKAVSGNSKSVQNRFTAYHRRKGGLATLFTHPNYHPYDSGVIVADESGAVTGPV